MPERGLVVLDAAAVPDGFSGARTRLRGLLAAYGALAGAPPLVVRIARKSRLLEGIDPGTVRVEEAPRPGGPWRRALFPRSRTGPDGPLVRAASLWHSETIPPLSPRGVPALLTIHDLRWIEPRAVTGAPWSKWAARHAAARFWLPSLVRALAGIVTVSNATRGRIESALRVPRERIHVVPNASAVEPSPRLTRDEEAALLARLGVAGEPYFLAVGHLEPRKGLDLVLRALARVNVARARLVVVGSGPAEASLRALARELGIATRVVFAGGLDEASTASLHTRAAALLFPSRLEGFGFPVYEALAHGTRVLARDLDVFAELSTAAVALLPDDADAWARALERSASESSSAASAAASSAAPRSAIGLDHPVRWSDAASALADVYRARLARTNS